MKEGSVALETCRFFENEDTVAVTSARSRYNDLTVPCK